jgi:hypothetical protein
MNGSPVYYLNLRQNSSSVFAIWGDCLATIPTVGGWLLMTKKPYSSLCPWAMILMGVPIKPYVSRN